MICPYCGEKISKGKDVCRHCGATLDSETLEYEQETHAAGGSGNGCYTEDTAGGYYGDEQGKGYYSDAGQDSRFDKAKYVFTEDGQKPVYPMGKDQLADAAKSIAVVKKIIKVFVIFFAFEIIATTVFSIVTAIYGDRKDRDSEDSVKIVVPEISVPDISVSIGDFSMPEISVPEINIPDISIPDLGSELDTRSYDEVTASVGIERAPAFSGAGTVSLVKDYGSDGGVTTVVFYDIQYEGDTIKNIITDTYYSVADMSEEERLWILEEALQQIEEDSGQSVCITSCAWLEDGWCVARYVYTDIDKPENYGDLYRAGILDCDQEISLSLTLVNMLGDGFIRK